MSEPESPQKMPFVRDLESGNYAWYACGKSATQA